MKREIETCERCGVRIAVVEFIIDQSVTMQLCASCAHDADEDGLGLPLWLSPDGDEREERR